MNKQIILTNQTSQGDLLQAIFYPSKGMNLISYKKGEIEVIDPSTNVLFDQRCAGLGALIGPHFHHRKQPHLLPHFDALIFPHLLENQKKAIKEPFSHGIARYVPWQVKYSTTQIHASLSGSDLYKGISLKALEGFDFKMKLDVKLLSDGLLFDYAVESEKPSIIGFHYYFCLPKETTLEAKVLPTIRENETWGSMKKNYLFSEEKIHLNLNKDPFDVGFQPLKVDPDPFYKVHTTSSSFDLVLHFSADNDKECSFQVFKPENSSFVCIEPLSALNPKTPILTRSRIQYKIHIV